MLARLMSGLTSWHSRLYGRRRGMQRRLLAWPLALLLVLAINGVSAYLALGLQINNAPEVYYRSDSPAVQVRDALRRDFPNDEVLTVVFQGHDLYGRDFLNGLGKLAETLERNPLVERVSTVLSMERISGSDDGFAVGPLVDLARLGKDTPQLTMQRVLSDRFAPGLLAARDGSLLAMAVRPPLLTESSQRVALKLAVATAINEAGLRPYYAGDAGPVTMDVAQLQSVLQDSKLFVPLTVAIGLGLLGWVVGRWRPVLIGAVALSTVVLPTLAGIALSGQPYTMATAILPSLLAAYTMATLLHLYAGVQRAQAGLLARPQALDRALTDTRKPSLFNVLTTGAGLLSMVLVPIPPIQVFGVAGAIGTLLVFVVVYFLVPPFLLRFDRRRWPQRRSSMKALGRVASRMALTSMRYPRAVIGLSAAVLLVATPLALKVTAESDVLAFFKHEHPINQHARLIESKLTGITVLDISITGPERDSLQSVTQLQAIRQFQRWLEGMPQVDRSLSMVDLVEEMNWAMNGEKASARSLPGSDKLLRQYLLVYDGKDLYELVNRDFQHTRIVVNMKVRGATEIGKAIAEIRQHLEKNPLPGLKVEIGGFGRLFADQVDLLVSGQINSFAGAFLQIFVFMAILWRSFSGAALCMVPNLAPLFFIFVLMGSTGIHLDLATVMIAGVVLGITVDDTIHLYHGYLHRKKAGISPVLAIARSFESSGRAVLAISVVLIAQFGLLAASDFIPTSNFGLMTAVGLLSGQIAELLLLPALLVLRDAPKRSARGQVAPKPPPREGTDTAWAPTAVMLRSADGAPGPGPAAPAALVVPLPHNAAQDEFAQTVIVCMGQACRRLGAKAVWQSLSAETIAVGSGTAGHRTLLVKSSCLGRCDLAPVVHVSPAGQFCAGTEARKALQQRPAAPALEPTGGWSGVTHP